MIDFENGEKLSRTHLPSIFPWSKEVKKVIVEGTVTSELKKHKRKADKIEDHRSNSADDRETRDGFRRLGHVNTFYRVHFQCMTSLFR